MCPAKQALRRNPKNTNIITMDDRFRSAAGGWSGCLAPRFCASPQTSKGTNRFFAPSDLATSNTAYFLPSPILKKQNLNGNDGQLQSAPGSLTQTRQTCIRAAALFIIGIKILGRAFQARNHVNRRISVIIQSSLYARRCVNTTYSGRDSMFGTIKQLIIQPGLVY